MKKYLIIINIVAFLIYGLDKYYAIKNKYRMSEFFILGIGFIGGVVGSIFGMYFFKHKTKKVKFKILFIIYIILWLIILKKFYVK